MPVQLSEVEKQVLAMAIISFLGEVPPELEQELSIPLLAVIEKFKLEGAVKAAQAQLRTTASEMEGKCCPIFDPFGASPIHELNCPTGLGRA